MKIIELLLIANGVLYPLELQELKSIDIRLSQSSIRVSLLGKNASNSPYCTNLRLLTNNLKIIPEISEGYDPDIVSMDFDGDGEDEVFFNINSGGSGAYNYSYIYKINLHSYDTIFNTSDITNTFRGYYVPGYKAIVTDDKEHNLVLDLSTQETEIKNMVYYPNGDLRKPLTLGISPVNTVFPYYDPFFKRFGLFVYQNIIGTSMSDNLGFLVSRMIYIKEFTIFSIFYQKSIYYPLLRQ